MNGREGKRFWEERIVRTKVIVGLLSALAVAAGCIHGQSSGPGEIQITTASLPDGGVGTAYSFQLEATRRHKGLDLEWTLDSGSSMPPGLTLASTGWISGTPTSAGEFSFVVKVTDNYDDSSDSKAYTLTITNMSISTTSLPDADVGLAYSAQIEVVYGVPPYTWSISNLPDGLTYTTNTDDHTCEISGTPTEAGPFDLTVNVTDSASNSTSTTITLTVVGLSIQPGTLSVGLVGSQYTEGLSASGGTAPYTWSVESGTLPPGLTLSAGIISGTPTSAGTYTFIVRVEDSGSPPNVGRHNYSITIYESGTLLITTPSDGMDDGMEGVNYAFLIEARGGERPYTFSLTSGQSLPGGLSLDAGGLISGTPGTGEAGTHTFTVQVTDSSPTPRRAYRTFTLTIASPTEVTIVPRLLPNAYVGDDYGSTARRVAALGGTPPYTWADDGNLPPNLTLDAASGVFLGTTDTPGTYTFQVTVTDKNGLQATRQSSVSGA